MRLFTAFVLAALAFQQVPPDTEIFLASLSIRNGALTIGEPRNISNSPGYDNQPSFSPDGTTILFTSVRGARPPTPAGSAATGSDIYRYDIAAAQITQVTDTPESEYSPTPTPDGRHFSSIRVEPDGTQRLWQFSPDGKAPELVLKDVKPVGYHAWVDAQTLVLFVLGPPATLQIADMATGRAEIVAKGIGRSIQRVPGGGVSFVLREGEGASATVTICELNPASRAITRLVAAVPGQTDPDLAWTPDGLLLTASGGQLYGWRRGTDRLQPLQALDTLGLRNVTRLAVSPRGDRIAIVAQAR